MSCFCEAEKNGYKDLELKQFDKYKVMTVHRILTDTGSDGLKFRVKFQKTGITSLEFEMKDITGIYA